MKGCLVPEELVPEEKNNLKCRSLTVNKEWTQRYMRERGECRVRGDCKSRFRGLEEKLVFRRLQTKDMKYMQDMSFPAHFFVFLNSD